MGQHIPRDGTTLCCGWRFLPFHPIDSDHSILHHSVVVKTGKLPFGDTFVLDVKSRSRFTQSCSISKMIQGFWSGLRPIFREPTIGTPIFCGGAKAHFLPSGFDFKLLFVGNKTKYEVVVGELKELLKLGNTTFDCASATAKIQEMAEGSNPPHLYVFRLQLFIPLAALCGLVLPKHLFHADYIEPSEGVANGSFSALIAVSSLITSDNQSMFVCLIMSKL